MASEDRLAHQSTTLYLFYQKLFLYLGQDNIDAHYNLARSLGLSL